MENQHFYTLQQFHLHLTVKHLYIYMYIYDSIVYSVYHLYSSALELYRSDLTSLQLLLLVRVRSRVDWEFDGDCIK